MTLYFLKVGDVGWILVRISLNWGVRHQFWHPLVPYIKTPTVCWARLFSLYIPPSRELSIFILWKASPFRYRSHPLLLVQYTGRYSLSVHLVRSPRMSWGVHACLFFTRRSAKREKEILNSTTSFDNKVELKTNQRKKEILIRLGVSDLNWRLFLLFEHVWETKPMAWKAGQI